MQIVSSPRPEDDKHPFDDATDFVECAACRVKPGAPTLCMSCLNNRAAIFNLKAKIAKLKKKLKKRKK